MLRRANARPAEEGGEFRCQLPVDPALRFELVNVLAPDILIVVERPDVERDHGTLFHQNRGPAVRAATYWKHSVAQSGAEYAPTWALKTVNLEKNVPEEDKGLNDVVCERLRVDRKDGVPEIGPDTGISSQLEECVSEKD